jgi:hypothetical protein
MMISQDDSRVWLPEDHPISVVVQKVFYRLLEAQGLNPSGWKISVVRVAGMSYPFGPRSGKPNSHFFRNRQYNSRGQKASGCL